jgi:phospholipase C
VVYVDSEEMVGEDNAADDVLDGRPDTIWHTGWYSSNPVHPDEVVISLGGSFRVGGFRYLPRQDGCPNGTVGQYRFYVSTDGVNWGVAAATGTFAPDTTEKKIVFPAHVGQYIWFVAESEVNGNPWTSAAEINILEIW